MVAGDMFNESIIYTKANHFVNKLCQKQQRQRQKYASIKPFTGNADYLVNRILNGIDLQTKHSANAIAANRDAGWLSLLSNADADGVPISLFLQKIFQCNVTCCVSCWQIAKIAKQFADDDAVLYNRIRHHSSIMYGTHTHTQKSIWNCAEEHIGNMLSTHRV